LEGGIKSTRQAKYKDSKVHENPEKGQTMEGVRKKNLAFTDDAEGGKNAKKSMDGKRA